MAERVGVLRDPLVEGFGDLLARLGFLQFLLVARVGEEADFGEDGRHGRPDQHDEGCLLYAAVARGGRLSPDAEERGVDSRGEIARLFDLFLQGDFLEEIAEFEDAAFAGCVFAGGDVESFLGGGEAEVVGFDAGHGADDGGVGVDGNEEIGFAFIGHFGAGFERDEVIVVAGVDDFAAEVGGDEFAEAEGDVEDEFLFKEPGGSGGALIVAAMAGVQDNAADF